MVLRIEPGPEGMPFEGVRDELGRVYVRCTQCSEFEHLVDGVGLTLLKSTGWGRVRFRLLTPWALAGAARFALRHYECLQTWNDRA